MVCNSLCSYFLLAQADDHVQEMEVSVQLCRVVICIYTVYNFVFQVQDAALCVYAVATGGVIHGTLP